MTGSFVIPKKTVHEPVTYETVFRDFFNTGPSLECCLLKINEISEAVNETVLVLLTIMKRKHDHFPTMEYID